MAKRPQDKGREAENFGGPFPFREWLALRRTKASARSQRPRRSHWYSRPMWEVKYLGKSVAARMAAWMRQVDVQTVNARADYGILIVKPPGVGERNAGKFWAVMRWDEWFRLMNQAGEPGLVMSPEVYPHSNAQFTKLPAKIVELDRIPGLEWVVSIPPRIPETMGLAVMTLERIVPILRTAGYGSPDVHAVLVSE